MRLHQIFHCFTSDSDNNLQQQQGGNSGKYQIFSGNDEYFIENGKVLLEERISLFDGRTNPIRCFSVDDLNSMNVNNLPFCKDGHNKCYAGVWDENPVRVQINNVHDGGKCPSSGYIGNTISELACREIAVATQMGTHGNANRLLGFCLFTKYPVLVYASAENGTLDDRLFKHREQGKDALEWKARLRIAWEIAHVVAYLHTAFNRPIIHRGLKPSVVFLDQDDSARLSDFSLAISIPKGKKDVEDAVRGTIGYVAPEYLATGRLAQSADVYSFGVLLLVILTGKPVYPTSELDNSISSWVSECHATNKLDNIVDPAITRDVSVADEHFENHLQEFVELALRCLSYEAEHRPTMVEVATELKNMILSMPHAL